MPAKRSESGRQSGLASLWLLRGPLLILIVLLSTAISVLQEVSLTTVGKLVTLVLGICLLCHDATRTGQEHVRFFLRDRLETLVWDDVLYQFFHPDVAWYNIFFAKGIVWGQAAWMYLLPSTTAIQRTRLLQASLHIHEDQARRLLFTPGGYMNRLLPQYVLDWLDIEMEGKKGCVAADAEDTTTVGDDTGGLNSMGCLLENQTQAMATTSSSNTSQPAIRVNGTPATTSDSESSAVLVPKVCPSGCDYPKRILVGEERNQELLDHQHQASSSPDNPTVSHTLKQIIRATLVEQVGEILQYTPDGSKITTLGLAATFLLAFHLRVSPRGRTIALALLETTSVLGLSTISLGAASLVLAKSAFPPTNEIRQRVNENNLHAYIAKVLQWRRVLMTGSASNGECRTSHGSSSLRRASWWSAVLVILLVGAKRQIDSRAETKKILANH